MSALPATRPQPSRTTSRPVGLTPSPVEPTPRPQLEVVGAPERTGRWVTLLLALVAAAVLGIVSLSALSAESSLEAVSMTANVEELSLRYDELTAEVAALESPERVRAVAVDELGMVASVQPAYLVLEGEAAADADERDSDLTAGVAGEVTDPVKHARSTDGPAADADASAEGGEAS